MGLIVNIHGLTLRFVKYDTISANDYVDRINLLMADLSNFVIDEVEIKLSGNEAVVLRRGWRAVLESNYHGYDLVHYLAGQIPYFYRSPERIAEDFKSRSNALQVVIDLATKAPTSPKFQRSHCGEILAALYLEGVLGFKRLYSKLTLTTSENTNVHKMDGFFVDLKENPYIYVAVEAKSSVLPTEKTPFRGHRYGVLKQLLDSFENYGSIDKRFDFTLIRDNLETFDFSTKEQVQIRKDLLPPGPEKFIHIGMATINASTISAEDDNFILCEDCCLDFNYRSVVVADLRELAKNSYGLVHGLKKAGGG